MKGLATCEDSKNLDAATRASLALSHLQLMEKASLRLWDALRKNFAGREELAAKGKSLRIVALCGKGDNGGDALAMLRHAYSAGFPNLEAIVSAREPSESAKKQAESLAAAGIRLSGWKANDNTSMTSLLSQADIVLDGILGTGLLGEANNEAKDMIECLNAIGSGSEGRPLLVSIDLPSGLGDNWRQEYPVVGADLTLCLAPAKEVCFLPVPRTRCGQLVTVEDVFPESLFSILPRVKLVQEDDFGSLLRPIRPESYKMSRGRVAIFAGSVGAIGAARLCAKAAAASGAGYVTLYADELAYPLLAKSMESIIVKPLAESIDLRSADAVLVGPGWGRDENRVELLRYILGQGLPAILDADALRLLAEHPGLVAAMKAPCALTPHPGELAALWGNAHDRSSPAESLAGMRSIEQSYASLVVAKSHVTWVVSREQAFVWDGMTPELGTAGTGDVLAGLFAGLLAGRIAHSRLVDDPAVSRDETIGKALAEAAICAVAAHGIAGRRVAKKKGWFEATELIEECSSLLHDRVAAERPGPPLTGQRSTH